VLKKILLIKKKEKNMKKYLIVLMMLSSVMLFAQSHNCKVWNFWDYLEGNETYSKVHWTGDIKRGKGVGYGKAYFDNGEIFEGTLVKGIPFGTGKYLKRGSFCNCPMDNSVFVGYWYDGLPSGKVAYFFSQPIVKTTFFSTVKIKYIAGNVNGSQWYAYGTYGEKLGWLSLENGGRKMVLHENNNIATFIGILGGIGVTVASFSTLAALTSPTRIFLLIIIL